MNFFLFFFFDAARRFSRICIFRLIYPNVFDRRRQRNQRENSTKRFRSASRSSNDKISTKTKKQKKIFSSFEDSSNFDRKPRRKQCFDQRRLASSLFARAFRFRTFVRVKKTENFRSVAKFVFSFLVSRLRLVPDGYYRCAKEFTDRELREQIDSLLNVATNLGRGRAWFFHAFNENLTESYIRSFQYNQDLMKKFYTTDSIVFDHQVGLFLSARRFRFDFAFSFAFSDSTR